MFKVRADPGKDRLYITLSGHLEEEERGRVVEAITQEVSKLSPGFDLINDISEALPTDAQGLDQLTRVQKLLVEAGLRHVVRITRMLITELQLERVSKDSGYRSIHLPSLEKAEQLLDSFRTPEGSRELRNWEKVRKYRRISVGEDHRIQFTLGDLDFTDIRITNLSAEGCFALIQGLYKNRVRVGTILNSLTLEHPDLPSTPITARIARIVPGLTEVTENDIGLGVQFLSTSEQFTQWVDAYVLAHYGLGE